MLDCDKYLRPTSLDEAFSLMEAHAGQYRLLAGATDLIPYAREARGGDLHVPVLIDLSQVAELRGIAVDDGRVRMGALTTFADWMHHPVLKEHARLLGQSAAWVADDQIRQVATIGGNIVNASPAADGTVALLALDATVTLESRLNGSRKSREMPLTEFVLGPGLTQIGPGEILTAITCSAQDPADGSAFEKVGRRRSLVIAVASAAAVVRLSLDGKHFESVRLALGAVSPVPVRLPECEAALQGQPVSVDAIRSAAALASDRVSSRTRQAYRRGVVVAFVERAIAESLLETGLNLEVVPHG